MIHWSIVLLACLVSFAGGISFTFLIVVKAITEAVEDFFDNLH